MRLTFGANYPSELRFYKQIESLVKETTQSRERVRRLTNIKLKGDPGT